jgi:hypothetical protein
MRLIVSEKFVDESWADKIRWFAALTFEERVAWLDEWTEIILQNNPDVLARFNDDSTFEGTVRVLEKTPG